MTRINGGDISPFGPKPEPKIPTTLEELEQLFGDAERIEAGEDLGPEPDLPPPAADIPWPDPEDLGTELPHVPAFNLLLLPDTLRSWVEDVADRMQVSVDYPATCALATLAGCCNRRAQIQAKALDTEFSVVPNLWGALVGPPGDLKTPTIKNITTPAHDIETVWRTAYEEAKCKYEAEKEIDEMEIDVWKRKYKNARIKGGKPDEKPQPKAVVPVQSKLVTTDATPEALHKLLSANPSGIFVIRDEITALLAGFDKAGHEQERGLWLECWNGNGIPYTMERIERGTLHVPNCCTSLFGGFQPGRLRSYMAGVLKNGPSNDGLMQRFQLVTWPDQSPDYIYTDREPNAKALEATTEAFQRIAALQTGGKRLRFDPDSQPFFEEWFTELEKRLRSGDLNPFMASHLAKYRSFMPSLALLLSLADHPEAEAVSLDHALNAADLCDYYEAHAVRMYSSEIGPEQRAAIALSRKLKKGWMRDEGKFHLRNVYFNGWSGLTTPEEVRAAVQVLERAGWVRPFVPKDEPKTQPNKGGRKPEVYAINPKIGGLQ